MLKIQLHAGITFRSSIPCLLAEPPWGFVRSLPYRLALERIYINRKKICSVLDPNLPFQGCRLRSGDKRRVGQGEMGRYSVGVRVMASNAQAASSLSDEELIVGISGGSQEALQELIERYATYLGVVVLRIAGASATAADVEEAVADCFVRVWRSLSAGKSIEQSTLPYDAARGPVKAWLAHVAHYEALSLRKRKQRQALLVHDESLLEAVDPSAPLEETVIDRLMNQQWLTHVQQALAALPPEDASILYQRYVHGYSPAEIAANLGITPNNARVRLSRAVKRLRERLEQVGNGET
jgi:RNA polymerase sigma-70 factor (ECF subfamily)